MAKERLLEKIAKKLSNQKYITRYHNTTNQGVRNMLNNGIKTSNSFGAEETPAVFTTAHPTAWNNHRRPAQVQLKIPKEWYKEHSIFDERDAKEVADGLYKNPYTRSVNGDNAISNWYDDIGEGQRNSNVYQGGRTSIFDEDIPPEFIEKACLDIGTGTPFCFDKKDFWKVLI